MEYIVTSIAIFIMLYTLYKSTVLYGEEQERLFKGSSIDDEEDEEDYVDDLKEQLDELKDNNPDLGFLSKKLKNHLYKIREQEEKLEYLETTPEKQCYIDEAYSSFEIVEEQICQNIDDILNICVAAGCNKGRVKWKDVDQEAINAELESNETKLALTQETLNKLMLFINQHDNESTNMDIVAMNKVLDTKLDQIVSK